MKLFKQALLVGLMVLFLQGCQLGDDDDGTVEEASDIIRAVSDTSESISRSDLYSFILTGDSNQFTLEDDLESINISGSDNIITIVEDTQLQSLTITGERNLVKQKSGVLIRIEDIIILGDGHSIIINEYVTVNDNGTGTSLSGTQVTL
jgi:hypothetical protein